MNKNSTPARILIAGFVGAAFLLAGAAARAEQHGGGDRGHGGGDRGHGVGDRGHGAAHHEMRHVEGHGGPGWAPRAAPWHEHDGWAGRGGWGVDAYRRPVVDVGGWRHGAWRHRCWDGRCGWWWLAGGRWFYYDQPVYPYPSAVSGVTFIDPALAPPASAPGYYLSPLPPG
jgi:hypothetical protein